MLLMLFLLLPFYTLWLGKIQPVLRRWYRRYAAYFTADGATLRTTARVDTARVSAVGVGLMLSI